MAAFGRTNTFQVTAASVSATVVTLKLPNGSTTSGTNIVVPANAKPIGPTQRYRLTLLIASFTVAAVSTPVALTVGDGVIPTMTFAVAGPLVLNPIDWQMSPGAEVDIVLAAGTGAIGNIVCSYTVE